MAGAAALVLAAAAVGGTVVLVPEIRESKQETAERELLAEQRGRAAERRRLQAEQRPVRGRLRGAGPAKLLPLLERAVSAEAAWRVARGELRTRARRGECELVGQARRGAQVSCVAVTSDIPATAESRGGISGYPFVGLIDLESGRYGICKTSRRPGEGSLGLGQQLELPRACGGSG